MMATLKILALLATLSVPSTNKLADSTRAKVLPRDENRRIWLEIGHPQSCRVQVAIFGTDGKKVRNYFDGALSHGVCNWYWDALNDSGTYVPEGHYRAVISDCGKPSYEDMNISYQKGERDFVLRDTIISIAEGLTLDVFSDSLRLTARISPRDNDIVYKLFPESVMHRGKHHFPLVSEFLHPSSRVRFVVRTRDLERTYEVILVP